MKSKRREGGGKGKSVRARAGEKRGNKDETKYEYGETSNGEAVTCYLHQNLALKDYRKSHKRGFSRLRIIE